MQASYKLDQLNAAIDNFFMHPELELNREQLAQAVLSLMKAAGLKEDGNAQEDPDEINSGMMDQVATSSAKLYEISDALLDIILAFQDEYAVRAKTAEESERAMALTTFCMAIEDLQGVQRRSGAVVERKLVSLTQAQLSDLARIAIETQRAKEERLSALAMLSAQKAPKAFSEEAASISFPEQAAMRRKLVHPGWKIFSGTVLLALASFIGLVAVSAALALSSIALPVFLATVVAPVLAAAALNAALPAVIIGLGLLVVVLSVVLAAIAFRAVSQRTSMAKVVASILDVFRSAPAKGAVILGEDDGFHSAVARSLSSTRPGGGDLEAVVATDDDSQDLLPLHATTQGRRSVSDSDAAQHSDLPPVIRVAAGSPAAASSRVELEIDPPKPRKG